MNTEEAKMAGVERKGRRRPQAEEREKILAAWAASGQGVDEVAAATGWTTWTLYRWRAEARGGAPVRRRRPVERPLVAVPLPAPAASGEWAAELLSVTGVRVRLAAGCGPAWAAQLIRELNRC